MPTIRLAPFGGMRPAINSPLRDVRYADMAKDTRLLNGSLQGIKEPRLIQYGPLVKSISCHKPTKDSKKCGIEFSEECLWSFEDSQGCGFDTCVVFYHRCENKAPERVCVETCASSPLCLNPPEKALKATVVDAGAVEQCDVRLYTYTWVTQFGDESAPAAPSNSVSLGDDGCVQLQGFSNPPAGATAIRIYRTSSPFLDGDDPNSSFDTTFQLVEEIDVDGFSGQYKDSKCLAEICLGTLDTMDYCCPPKDICGIVKTESGYYVAWSDNNIWVSERHNAANFPLVNMLELEERIVGGVAHRDTVLFGTTGSPYRVTIAAQENGDLVDGEYYRDALPMVSPDSMVSTPWGAIYATDIGLVGLFPNRAASVITRERINEDDWRQYIPDAAAWYRGRYYGFREKGCSFVFDVAEQGESRLELGDFHLLSFNAEYAKVCSDGNMYLIQDGNRVFDWENGINRMPYTWLSKRFHVNSASAFEAIAIYGSGPVRVRLFADGCEVFNCTIDACGPISLPRLPKARSWQVELYGTHRVDEVSLGPSISEVSQSPR